MNKYGNNRKPISMSKFNRVFKEHYLAAGVATVCTHNGVSPVMKNSIQAVAVGDVCYTKWLDLESNNQYCVRYSLSAGVDNIQFQKYPTEVFKQLVF